MVTGGVPKCDGLDRLKGSRPPPSLAFKRSNNFDGEYPNKKHKGQEHGVQRDDHAGTSAPEGSLSTTPSRTLPSSPHSTCPTSLPESYGEACVRSTSVLLLGSFLDTYPLQSVKQSVESDEAVEISRLCVKLHLPLGHVAPFNAAARRGVIANHCPVKITLVSISQDATLHLSFCGLEPHPETVDLELTTEDPAFVQTLQQMVELQRSTARSKKAKLSAIVWAESYIVAPREQDQPFLLKTSTLWKTGVSAVELKLLTALKVLSKHFPSQQGQQDVWSPQDFYNNVHVPSRDAQVPAAIQSGLLESQLYPFQRRAIAWLLSREGARISANRKVEALPGIADQLPFGVFPSKDVSGRIIYVSHLHGSIFTDKSNFQDSKPMGSGGILAEEMGLGKTVELISLVCLHQRPTCSPSVIWDEYTKSSVMPTKATLIISPRSILQQWVDEIRNHAPSLQVHIYRGVKSSELNDEELALSLLQFDIVLTTYSVLASEIYYARAAPERNFRHTKRYEARVSPLMRLSWWRVCLDEAQMVESGVSNAATVARLIPRVNAWAVTGTPLRKDISDLGGLLIFLHYEPYCSSFLLWQRLTTNFKHVFNQIVGSIAMRHTKVKVRQDLDIPPQRRVVLRIPFNLIEEQHYTQLFQQMCESCGLNHKGEPAVEDFDPDSPQTVEKMRVWLNRLRQTCLHPEVGDRNRRALGRDQGALKTVAEVLEVMIEQNDSVLRQQQRSMLLLQIKKGQISEHQKDPDAALDIYYKASVQATTIVDECRAQLEEEKALERSINNNPENLGELEDKDENSDDKLGRIGIFRNRLRVALEVQHIATFFTANAYFQLKERSLSKQDLAVQTTEVQGDQKHEQEASQGNKDSEDNSKVGEDIRNEIDMYEEWETQFYEKAKNIRKELLAEPRRKAEDRMMKLRTKLGTTSVMNIPDIAEAGHQAGIENRRIADKLKNLLKLMHRQELYLDEWRKELTHLLCLPLVDTEDTGVELTGEEYEESTKRQDDVYVYIDAFRAVVADRNFALTGMRNQLIDHEMKEAFRLAGRGKGHNPELFLRLMSKRNKMRSKEENSLRGLIAETRNILTALQWQENTNGRASAEASLVNNLLTELQQRSKEQAEALASLEKETAFFRETMNLRLEYYRQLQEISDTVAPLEEEGKGNIDLHVTNGGTTKEERLKARIATLKTKQKFLLHLKADASNQNESKICIICQSGFENGVLTVCGHQYCKECIMKWWSTHRSCPLCKRRLQKEDFHAITNKTKELRAQEETIGTSPSRHPGLASSSRDVHNSLYSNLSQSTLSEIKSIDLEGAFGTKIDTIARHIIHLRTHDPGSKSVIFSQYRDFLQVLSHAFTQFHIGHTSFIKPGGIQQFKNDPTKEVFLLHAKADSSGLNLVNATHVFLCEPIINTAIEVQAVARVHRIGQRRPTTVYTYLIEDTVEEAIYDLSVRRRLAHIERHTEPAKPVSHSPKNEDEDRVKDVVQDAAIDAADSLTLQTTSVKMLLAKNASGGEMVGKEDLWACLFGKPRTDRGVVGLDVDAAEAAAGGGDAGSLGHEVARQLRADAAEARTEM